MYFQNTLVAESAGDPSVVFAMREHFSSRHPAPDLAAIQTLSLSWHIGYSSCIQRSQMTIN
jgi:hypothetical protein